MNDINCVVPFIVAF